MQSVSTTAHVAVLREAGGRLAAAASSTSWDTPIPTCPDWQARDLVHHIGGVHRWAASIVANRRSEPYPDEEEATFFQRPSDAELLEWFRAGHERLVKTLQEADPSVECWSFLPAPSPLAFWARRQAHETVIHCFDVEVSAGVPVPGGHITAELAVDGIDELLCGFLVRKRGGLVADPPTSLSVQPTDSPHAWTIRIEPAQRIVTRSAQAADCAISGRASDLYLFLWNRLGRESVAISGDRSVLDLWHERAHVRWA